MLTPLTLPMVLQGSPLVTYTILVNCKLHDCIITASPEIRMCINVSAERLARGCLTRMTCRWWSRILKPRQILSAHQPTATTFWTPEFPRQDFIQGSPAHLSCSVKRYGTRRSLWLATSSLRVWVCVCLHVGRPARPGRQWRHRGGGIMSPAPAYLPPSIERTHLYDGVQFCHCKSMWLLGHLRTILPKLL